MDLEFQLLGPLAVNQEPLRGVPPKSRALLAMLLLDANRCIPMEQIVTELWGDRPPRSAAANVRTYATAVRRVVERTADAAELTARGSGYLLAVPAERLDLFRFRELGGQGRAALGRRDLSVAAEAFAKAERVWRGAALETVPLGPTLAARKLALDEERISLVEEHCAALLGLGRHEEAVRELVNRVAQHPFRERLCGQLMCALVQAGRSADALLAFRRLRDALATELGVEPGAALQRLHRQVLAGEPVAERPATDPATPSEEPAVPVPAQLPAAVADFTGRAGTLVALDAAHRRYGTGTGVGIALVTGVAGVGKSALAVHWGHRNAHQFPDGQLYADLRGSRRAGPADPLEVLAAWLRSLGLPAHQVPGHLDEATALYRSLLARRRMLVLLDDAATDGQVSPLLPGTAGCFVCVTSRHRLAALVVRNGARHVQVEPLSLDEAVGLVTRLIGPERMAAAGTSAAELARAAGCSPLALRTAGAALIFEQATRPVVALGTRKVGEA
jgi:DNA-binding SARP family transcriptional activator